RAVGVHADGAEVVAEPGIHECSRRRLQRVAGVGRLPGPDQPGDLRGRGPRRRTGAGSDRVGLAGHPRCEAQARGTSNAGWWPLWVECMAGQRGNAEEEGFAALLAASERATSGRERRLAAGDVVRGRVISVGATTAFVAVGGKAEAAIDVAEFRDPETGAVALKEGDEIEATIVDDGSRTGSIGLRRWAGRGGHLPGELEQAFANRIPVEGLVTGEVKGGYSVQL